MGSTSYKLDKTVIANDLSKERPQWILSAYGPGVKAPLQLFGGFPREQSFEELRVRHYELAAQGNPQQAIQQAQTLVNSAEQQIQIALNDVDGAIKYIMNGEKEHPNRIDIALSKGALPPQSHVPGQTQQPAAVLSQPSAPAPSFGQPPGPAPSFGQSSAPTPSFGQTSAFGQPAMLGRPTTSFGQSSSAFGKSAIPAPGFGQPSAPSRFGVPQQNPSPFGAPSEPSADLRSSSTANQPSNPFGQPPVPVQTRTFGQFSGPDPANPFSQNVRPGPTPSPFGRPTASSPAATQNSKIRISYSNRPVPSFGFSLEAQIAALKHARNANILTAQPISGPTSNESAARPPGGQAANGKSTPWESKEKIQTWKGKSVRYFDDEPCYNDSGNWHRIWFPHGPPVFTAKTPELPEEIYSTATRDSYDFVKQHGIFKDGIMPEMAPRRDWCNWEF